VIHYALTNNRIAKEYLTHFTNAAFIVKEGFELPEDGLYSGFDPATQVYDKSTWNYEEGGDLSGTAAAIAPGANGHSSHSEEGKGVGVSASTAHDGNQRPGATTYAFASEVLRFYKRLAGFQKAVYSHFEGASGRSPVEQLSGIFRHQLNLSLLLPMFPNFLSDIEAIAPEPIAHSARDQRSQPDGQRQDLLTST